MYTFYLAERYSQDIIFKNVLLAQTAQNNIVREAMKTIGNVMGAEFLDELIGEYSGQ